MDVRGFFVAAGGGMIGGRERVQDGFFAALRTGMVMSGLTGGVENIPVKVFAEAADASVAVAREIAELIRAKAGRGERAVLGLATGSTPVGVYAELVRMCKAGEVSFKNVVTFNLDEYFPMGRGSCRVIGGSCRNICLSMWIFCRGMCMCRMGRSRWRRWRGFVSGMSR